VLWRRSFVQVRVLRKSRLSLFPLNTAPVVRRVVSPAATALSLFTRGGAPIGEVGAATRDAPRRVSTVKLRVSKALAAFTLQWAFWGHARFHRHSQSAEFGELSHFRHHRPSCYRDNEVGVGGRSLSGSWSRRPNRSCMTPWTRMFRD
jgi:hypothetical protein